MRRAYRRPIDENDLAKPMALYHQAREGGDFEAGIELALSSILVNPWFLFRIESDPAGLRRNSLPHERPRTGIAVVVLFVEQHPG